MVLTGRLATVILAVTICLGPALPGQSQPHQRGAWAARQEVRAGAATGEAPERPFRPRRFEEDGGSGPEGEQRAVRRRARNPEGQERAFSPAGQPGGRERQGGQGAGGRRFGAPIDLQKLGLTDEQKQRIRELRGRNSARAKELRESLRSKRNEMRGLLFDPGATESQIRTVRRQLRQMQDQMEEMQIDDFLSMRSVLTAEQRKRLPEIMPRPGGGPRGGDGPPQMPPPAAAGNLPN